MLHFERERRQRVADALVELTRSPDVPLANSLSAQGWDELTVEQTLEAIEQWRLALPPDEDGQGILLDAGEQFLSRSGDVETADLEFLPLYLDDLDGRWALRQAGFELINESLRPFPRTIWSATSRMKWFPVHFARPLSRRWRTGSWPRPRRSLPVLLRKSRRPVWRKRCSAYA